MSRRTSDRPHPWSREPLYLAYLAIAVASIWGYAWSAAVAARPHAAPQRRLMRTTLTIERQRQRAFPSAGSEPAWGL